LHLSVILTTTASTKVGLFHPTSGTVTLRSGHEPNSTTITITFGRWSDRVVAGDWNGDGDATLAGFRPGDRQVHLSSDVDPLGTLAVESTVSDWYPISGNFHLR